MFKTHPSVVKLETSLINNKNYKSPNTKPRGTPLYTSWKSEQSCWKYTICLRFFQVPWEPVKLITSNAVHFQLFSVKFRNLWNQSIWKYPVN